MALHVDTPVLVVGGGPVGLTAARLLSGIGRRCTVVERREGPQWRPAAHVVNARTLEIFRQAGFDMEAVLGIAADPADAGHVNIVTTLDGDLIGRLPFERQGDECLALTPTPLRNIPQHRLEPLLADAVGRAPGVELRYRTEWMSCEQDVDGVTSIIRDTVTGEETTVRSRHLLAADGASSSVRAALGIEMVGPSSIQSFVAIHVRANLRSMVAGRPGVLHFVMHPATIGTFIAHDVDADWVFMTAFDPQAETVADYDTARCTAIVRTALGDDTVPIEVVGVGTWHMTAQVAERFRDRRVFLVGDAAHRFPPTGGMGLNTGVADAHNLVWKLGAVEDGWASAALLDTYDLERRPVAATNCEQSLTNAVKMALLFEALGLREGTTAADLAAVLADPARRDDIDRAVAEQATHFDMLGLQLGAVYGDGALLRSGPPPGPVVDPSSFDPDASVGGRLPHGWLADGRSTLDLVSSDSMTLLSFGDHDGWAASAAGAPVPLCHVRLDRTVEVDPAWRDRCGVGASGALLVRPDQHVAWRAEAGADAVESNLADALRSILG